VAIRTSRRRSAQRNHHNDYLYELQRRSGDNRTWLRMSFSTMLAARPRQSISVVFNTTENFTQRATAFNVIGGSNVIGVKSGPG